ncbi:Phosphoglycolate phosphatase, HAD superfamily [Verrucomicrobium sp. GAS474]|uniref:NUDIX domain-containing protein n=1 Tax=Verrucomicrobium sp. GAS474 TaxID=1882831 RepID=UPI000879F32B|nr:NUDIX domain-containing protein [Verrucomicrobium sp. GAS474]SDT96272.1 Phosphoglycolate phosphatase, HAD superfamily [Verrucomicrobium sp. GAS474]
MAVIKNLILDWSGTLVDDFPPVLTATNALFEKRGKPAFSRDEFREKFRLPYAEFYKDHLPDATMEELELDYHEAFRHIQEEIPLLPFARDFLDYAHGRKMPVFLLSTIHADHFAVQSARLGIADCFTQAYTRALDKRKTITVLLAEHGLDPAETLFVGDMQHDIETARHGGVTSCAVLTGYDSLAKLKASNPDLLFQNLHQVRQWLEQNRTDAHAAPPVPTVGALIYNARGEVLMIETYKWSHCWGIPGGKIKGGETALDAVRREVREETGLDLAEIRFAGVQDCLYPPEFFRKAHFLLLTYTAALPPGASDAVTLNEEADRFRWVKPGEALSLNLNGPSRALLNHVRSHPDLAFAR